MTATKDPNKVLEMKTLSETTFSEAGSAGYRLVIRRKRVEIVTSQGKRSPNFFEIDYQNPNALSEESNDFCLTFSHMNLSKVLRGLLQDQELRRTVVEYLKENP